MCGRCLGHLVKSDEEIVCVVCGWRSYPIPRRLRLGPRDRAQRRARVRRVALEASARGACHVLSPLQVFRMEFVQAPYDAPPRVCPLELASLLFLSTRLGLTSRMNEPTMFRKRFR